MSTPIRPLHDCIVIKSQDPETKSAGGIVFPDTANQDKPLQGDVLAVGPGKCVDGKVQAIQVKVGDKVLFGKYAGTNVKLADKEYLIVRENDILGVIE